MTHRVHDAGGVYDSFYKELAYGHHIERLQKLLGPTLTKLIEDYETERANSAGEDTEALVAARDRVASESHGRMTGRWQVYRYDAPIEWYAEKIVGHPVPAFHELPASIQQQADRAMKRDKTPVRTEFDETFDNLFMTQGVSTLWHQSTSDGTTNSGAAVPGVKAWFNNAQAIIGVGDSATAAANTQFDLQAATNRLWVAMDSTYPTLPLTTSNAIVFRSTFASAQANYA
jgi:hypothetical protein